MHFYYIFFYKKIFTFIYVYFFIYKKLVNQLRLISLYLFNIGRKPYLVYKGIPCKPWVVYTLKKIKKILKNCKKSVDSSVWI